MKIEVAVNESASKKEKGDLLEDLAEKLLSAQSFSVKKEVRKTGVELDLLCKSVLNKKEIYVECKAYRNPIDANILKNLAGTLLFKDYSEVWLISTSEYGKEAKGFLDEWQKKPPATANRISFITPDKIIGSLIGTNIIKPKPEDDASRYIGSKNLIGDWILLLTPYGLFWTAAILSGGIPEKALCFYARDNELVEDEELLLRLSETDTSLNTLDFSLPKKIKASSSQIKQENLTDVVEVQTGEEWSDYRPARPEDFVGRSKDIKYIYDFFKKITKKETGTRVFAITGNSGMGKSSLIAKLASKSRNKQNKNKYFVYSVDVRAAKSPEYIFSALIKALKSAQSAGFGDTTSDLYLTNVSNPLNSDSIKNYLESVENKEQLIILVFDQFEELYSKQELYSVFERASELLLNAAAIKLPFCLGFAWKTDSTTHNEHPAYFFWHKLSDYRVTRKLSPFTDNESNAAINVFEREIKSKIHQDLKHNLIVGSQGYPWLLKKLCIHLYEKIETGSDQKDLLENKLDVASLFNDDLEQLSPAESSCLKFIANRAPVDWFEVIDVSGPETLKSLIDRRLVVRSGDRLNLYWDIFREYVLTSQVPVIPFRYLPSTDFTSIYKVAKHLTHEKPLTLTKIKSETGFSEGTIFNVGSDLIMFGIAYKENGDYFLSDDVPGISEKEILRVIRKKFKKHALTLAISERHSRTTITLKNAIEVVRNLYPSNTYADKTWHAYTARLFRWLELSGLVVSSGLGWYYRDHGDVITERERTARKSRTSSVFTGAANPTTTIDALGWLKDKKKVKKDTSSLSSYRNAVYVLARLGLATTQGDSYHPTEKAMKFRSEEEAVWVCVDLPRYA